MVESDAGASESGEPSGGMGKSEITALDKPDSRQTGRRGGEKECGPRQWLRMTDFFSFVGHSGREWPSRRGTHPPEPESHPGEASYVLRVCGALEGLDRVHSPHGATVVCQKRQQRCPSDLFAMHGAE